MTYNEFTGDRDDLIRMYVPLAYRIAANYRHLSYNNLSGLQGEALLTLVRTVDMIIATPKKWDTQITSIIVIAIKRELIEYSVRDRPMYQSRWSHNHGKDKCPVRECNGDKYSVMDSCKAPMSKSMSACEMRENLDDIGLSQQERRIVSLWLMGYTSVEVAEMCNVSKQRIFQIRQQIQAKVIK